MRLVPKSLAGRLAGLLILTLVAAQVVTFLIFAGERVAAFRHAYREDLFIRIVSLVELLDEAPADLHDRLVTTASSPLFRISLDPEPVVGPDDRDSETRASLAAALNKPAEQVRVALGPGGWRREREERRPNEERRGPPHPPRWVTVSIQLDDGRWLNAFADRPPVPPLGRAFLASFLISAAAVAAVGAAGIRWASAPLRRLADAADRLGRGESFEPLPETGPQETRQANVAFNRMRERLDRFIRDRTAMLAAIAHDLRTPITSLRLRAEFIDDEETRTKVLETLAEMQAMTEAVLAFARGDAESEESRPTDISALVESVVEDMREAGRDAHFTDSSSITVKCRPFTLRRALGNLIENACLYGGSARAKVESGPSEVRIFVDDDGPGIPPADLERVFEPFVRLEGSRSRETGGAGLGLSIARSIFRAHGGDLKLENRPEGGLRAIGTLPA